MVSGTLEPQCEQVSIPKSILRAGSDSSSGCGSGSSYSSSENDSGSISVASMIIGSMRETV